MLDQRSKRGTRRDKTLAAALRQQRIQRHKRRSTYPSLLVHSPHYYAKRHSTNCGRPKCLFCTNPRHNPWRKARDRLTIQELRAAEAAKAEIYAPEDPETQGIGSGVVLWSWRIRWLGSRYLARSQVLERSSSMAFNLSLVLSRIG